jgi:hypothetical protein
MNCELTCEEHVRDEADHVGGQDEPATVVDDRAGVGTTEIRRPRGERRFVLK